MSRRARARWCAWQGYGKGSGRSDLASKSLHCGWRSSAISGLVAVKPPNGRIGSNLPVAAYRDQSYGGFFSFQFGLSSAKQF